MPKSPTMPMGEKRPANKLTIVVTAARTSGKVTFRNPTLTATSTGSPATRCSR